MKVILTSIGTRGDMEPFLAIGEILKERDHDILCMFPEQFRKLADDSGFPFASLGPEFIEMLNSPEGKTAMGGGGFGFKKLRAYLKLIKKQSPINRKMIQRQHEIIEKFKPDRIVHSGKVMYPVIWSLENKGKTTLISPVPYMHYVKDHAHVAFNKNYGAFINKLTYKLANFGLVKTIIGSVKWLFPNRKIKQKQIQEALFTNNAIYTISPALFQRPDYWNDNIKVLGYHERNKTNNWQPSTELVDFIHKHPKIILVTFGSMVNSNPVEKTRIILNILSTHKIPAIINTASGGLIEPNEYDRNLFHFVKAIPYDWVFPKMYAVIHHGGSGTTHTALKYGCASLIIPHIIDQFVWNKIIHRKGAGPLGKNVGRITTKNLEPKILDLMNNTTFKHKAEEIGREIQNESFRDELHQAIVE